MENTMQEQFWSRARHIAADKSLILESPTPTTDQFTEQIGSIFETEPSNIESSRDEESTVPAVPGWMSMDTCIANVLDNRDAVNMFLTIFSLSTNFDWVVDTLGCMYYSNPLSDATDLRIKVLTLATKFAESLWLTDGQIDSLSRAFRGLPQHPSSVDWVLTTFHESLEKVVKQTRLCIPGPIASLNGKENVRALAVQFAHAFAILEDGIRRTDPVGECIRWSARKYSRDFPSFPERITMWVLQSVLQDEMPEKVGIRYLLFYKVAKRSKEIHNFSAVSAIISALQDLDKIRVGAKVETTELMSMTRLGREAAEHDAYVARRKQRPYLQPLHHLLSRTKFVSDNVADTHHQIHWDNYAQLLHEVKDFTTHSQLTSPQEYGFRRNPMVDFVKQCLINVRPMEDIEDRVDMSIHRYWESQPVAGPPFRESEP